MLTTELKKAQDNLLLSVLVFPFYFFRGFLVWFALLFLAIKILVEGSRFTPPKPNLYADQAPLGRSLSQFGDDDAK